MIHNIKCSIHNTIENVNTNILTDGFFINDKYNTYTNGMRISMVLIYLYI